RLFTADFDRLSYKSGYERFVVSPDNARERLALCIKGARKQLLIYDPQATDDAMLRLLTEQAKAGVDVRVIGRLEAKWSDGVKNERYPGKRRNIRPSTPDGK